MWVHVADSDRGKSQKFVWLEIHVVFGGGRHREVRVKTMPTAREAEKHES